MMTLEELQNELAKKGFQALIVTRNNMFLGQDVLPEENKVLELTGFSGSEGTLLVSSNACYLFVDGRYQIQARKETDPQKVSVIDCNGNVLELIRTICLKNGWLNVGYNPWCLSVNQVKSFLKMKDIKLIEQENILGPILSSRPVKAFVNMFGGQKSKHRCEQVAAQIALQASVMIICASDEVSWLTDIRSDALPYSPVLRAYAVLDASGKVRLFADNVQVKGFLPVSALSSYLAQYENEKILADFNDMPQKILSLLPEGVTIEPIGKNPIELYKLEKSIKEIDGFKEAHIRDGVAVTKFLYWLDQNQDELTELDVVAKLHEFRAQQEFFFSESFATIAASGANAAIIHYQPTPQTNAKLEKDSVLLLDSGGQYFDGTTDVTRTIALGQPSEEIKEMFTLVLKAHIALADAIFPTGTPGNMLDALARSVMWRACKDYKHGTGHSVGTFSNVHEGPFAISPKNMNKIRNCYVVSNEPGYYKEGSYGIRIENLVYTQPVGEEYLCFKNLTLVPIDKRLIKAYMLNRGERDWLNNYHHEVWNCLAPRMDENEKEWLKGACSPI